MYGNRLFIKYLTFAVLLILASSAPTGAWEWQSIPKTVGQGDLCGEIISIDNDQVTLSQLDLGELTVPLNDDCVLNLNSLPSSLEALSFITSEYTVEALVYLSADGRVSSVDAFYYVLEVEITSVAEGIITFRPLNSQGEMGRSTFSQWPAEVLPQIGFVFLIQMDSTGKVKECQQTGILGGERVYLANTINQSS